MTAKQLLFHDDARDNIRRGIEIASDTVVAQLKQMAKPCASSQEIAHVASISANNDRSIGELLASAIDKVGREGVVLEDAAILLFEGRLSSLKDLLPLLDEIVKEGRPLLVIAEDVDRDSLAALVVNTIRGTLKTCAVKAPGFGERRKAMMQDLAVLTDCNVVSDEIGLTLSKVKLSDLGRATRVEINKETTTLINGAGQPQAIKECIATSRKERELVCSDYDRAVEEDIVPGGGVALLRARRALLKLTGSMLDETSGIRLVAFGPGGAQRPCFNNHTTREPS